MHKYMKKPVIIEAFQLTEESRVDNSNWPQWMHLAWNKEHSETGALYPADFPNSDGNEELKITTLEGTMRVSFGDYIIRGVRGELYPCKPDIFEETYTKVPEEV